MKLQVIYILLGLGFSLISIEGNEKVPLPEHVSTILVNGRIVKGLKAAVGQFPYTVSLRRRWTDSHFCGGTIIHKNWILTAGHCMFRYGQLIGPSTFYVVAGEIRLTGKSNRKQVRNITRLYVHPEFEVSDLSNDAALLLVDDAFTITDHVSPLPMTSSKPVANTSCVVAGWGYLREGGAIASNDLMYLDLPILNQTICKSLLGHLTPMSEAQMCAGFLEGKKDACQGDSGGPLMCKGSLSGIVSGGYGCARPKLPGFYTNVAYYKKWIGNIMQNTTISIERKRGMPGGSTTAQTSALLISFLIYSLKSLYQL